MDAIEERVLTGAEEVSWDLTDLYETTSHLEADLETASTEAERFAERIRGKVDTMSAEGLAKALQDYESIHCRIDRASTYSFLNWCTQTTDASSGALLQKVREQYSQIGQKLIFFEIELIALPEERITEFIRDEELRSYWHFLETLKLRKDHILTEPEEKIMAEKSVTGAGAWVRFFDETLGAARFPFRGKQVSEQELLSLLYDRSREKRRDAANGFTKGLQNHLRSLTFIFNTMLADKAADDRLRSYEHWLAPRNISNEISDESVQALVEAVTSRYDLVSRFYTLKKRLLGLDVLHDYDRYAPIGEAETRYSWDQAQKIVIDAYSDFHPQMRQVAQKFFDGSWIHAALRPGKRGGAFSHPAVPDVHPYILVNFTGNTRDVQTLAHELGHGVHQYLSRKQGALQANTPLTTAETASVFAEMLVFERMMKLEKDPRNQLAMVMGKIDDTIATVFRQISMNRFEERLHNARRDEGELSSTRISQLWRETQEAMFLGSVELGEHYDIWWSYIPHFIHTPGYVYAYAFGELLVLALYGLYQAGVPRFEERYLELLEAGGSDWPHVLIAKMGVDLQEPEFWEQGLSEIEKLITQAESLAKQVDNLGA
ncbi:MAG: M3 family oligoendopeptidase [Acidobacteriota bacterium]|nr:MAG: M3 family oligoendopeptidase [Acidobacteriota bacterium]